MRGLAEFDDIFDSLSPELAEDLERIDFRIRKIWMEARTCGVPKKVIEQRMPERVIGLMREVSTGLGEG